MGRNTNRPRQQSNPFTDNLAERQVIFQRRPFPVYGFTRITMNKLWKLSLGVKYYRARRLAVELERFMKLTDKYSDNQTGSRMTAYRLQSNACSSADTSVTQPLRRLRSHIVSPHRFSVILQDPPPLPALISIIVTGIGNTEIVMNSNNRKIIRRNARWLLRIWTPPVLQAFFLWLDGTTAHVYPACKWALFALAIMGYSHACSSSP
jgi:hypothetical protein